MKVLSVKSLYYKESLFSTKDFRMKKIVFIFSISFLLMACSKKEHVKPPKKIIEVVHGQNQFKKSRANNSKIRQQNFKIDIKKQLILHYNFDQKKKNRVFDLSGYKRDGIVKGAKLRIDKQKGNVYDFKGIASIQSNTGDEGFPIGDQPRSVSVWIKFYEMKPSFQYFLHYGQRGQGRVYKTYNKFYGLLVDKRVGRRQFAFTQFGAVFLSSKRLVTNKWYHMVHNYHGNNQHSFYINGKNHSGTNEMYAPLATKKGGSFILGSPKYFSKNPFNGSIASVRIYKRALLKKEIEKLYQLGK